MQYVNIFVKKSLMLGPTIPNIFLEVLSCVEKWIGCLTVEWEDMELNLAWSLDDNHARKLLLFEAFLRPLRLILYAFASRTCILPRVY